MATILDVRKQAARGSTRRFLMLLCLLVVSCVYMFYVMALTVDPASFAQCAGQAGLNLELLTPGTSPLGADEFESCREDAANRAGVIAVVGTTAVLAVAALVYWLLPAWRWRRGRLIPVERIAEPTRRAGTEPLPVHLARLAREAGISRMPAFAVDPRALTAGAVAFGRAGRYTVCLHAGLVARRVTAPGTFDAVVRHELAHVRSRDVDVAYLAVALWRAVSLGALVPFVLLQSWLLARDLVTGADRVDWVQATPSLGKLAFGAFLVAQVYLARNELLRSREMCADLDAVAAGADPQVWDPRARGVPVDADGEAAASPGWFASLWDSHPSWQRRYAVLAGSHSIATGAGGLQALLAFGALFGVVGTFEGLPRWLLVSMVYVVGPIVVTTLIVSTPQKRPGFLRISEPTTEGRRRVLHPLVPLTALAAVYAALLVYDPLEGYRDDGIVDYPAPEVPYPYGRDGPTFTLLDEAAIGVWLNGGGREAIVDLRRSFDVDLSGLLDAPQDSPELTDHCAMAASSAAAGRDLPPPPHPAGELAWDLMLSAAESGSDVVCTPPLPGEPAEIRERQSELHYESVQAAYRSLVVLLDPYTEVAFPPG